MLAGWWRHSRKGRFGDGSPVVLRGNIRGDVRVVDFARCEPGWREKIQSEGLMIEARGLSKRFHDKK
jgi:hypothetical protein